jgi:sterol desaturase/sphingolipid hydroxylase (fatty acid hydroxylase superfamily)
VFAIPLSSVLTFEALILVATGFHHSDLKLPPRLERALSWIVVTPSIHWVHHHRIRRDTDSNYSTILSLWDRLFASRSATRRTPDMEIGVEGREEQDLPKLLLRPFGLGKTPASTAL